MSLRARLIALLVVVSTLGMLILAAATYSEQRSFLLQRVEEQGASVVPEVAHQLAPNEGDSDPHGQDHGGGSDAHIGTGVYGQLRDASGNVLNTGALTTFGETAPPAPKWPGEVSTDHWSTADSVNDSGVRYRVRAFSQPDSSAVVLVALPLNEVDRTLNRLLGVEALVIAAVLLALAGLARWFVRLGLRPLERMGATAPWSVSRPTSTPVPRTRPTS